MPNKNMEDSPIIEEFDDDGSLEFDQQDELDFAADEDLLLEEGEDEEDLVPSVLYKGVSRPKTDDDWRQLLLEASRENVPTYQLAEMYREGMLIIHPQFGLGVVAKVISPHKIEVIFETSKKLMAMNLTPPPEGNGLFFVCCRLPHGINIPPGLEKPSEEGAPSFHADFRALVPRPPDHNKKSRATRALPGSKKG